MTKDAPPGGLTGKVIVLLLCLILGCPGLILYKLYQPPPAPLETSVSATVTADLPEPPAPAPIASPSLPARPPAGVAPPAPRRPPPPPPVASVPAPEQPTPPLPEPPAVVAEPAPAPAVVEPAATPPVLDAISAAPAASDPTVLVYQALSVGSEMKLEGNSTAHRWACIGKIIAGSFEVEPAWLTDPSLRSVASLGMGRTPPKCELKIPVRTLKSQVSVGASIMDSRMQAEMNIKQYPMIEYRLVEMAIKGRVPSSGSPVEFDTAGLLVARGVTNLVRFPVRMDRIGPDRLRFTGALETKMTAFGIKPPEFTVLGVGMKAYDPIKLTWIWTLGLPPATAASR